MGEVVAGLAGERLKVELPRSLQVADLAAAMEVVDAGLLEKRPRAGVGPRQDGLEPDALRLLKLVDSTQKLRDQAAVRREELEPDLRRLPQRQVGNRERRPRPGRPP